MEIVPDLIKSNLSKNQVEYIQKKQHEYKLTNKKRRVPGHILFSVTIYHFALNIKFNKK